MLIIWLPLHLNLKHYKIMSKTEFNKNFTLSLNGKYAGLDRIQNQPLFFHKLAKVLKPSSKYRKPLGDTISMRVSGQTIKLYFR